MKCVIQRVKKASCIANGEQAGTCEHGFLLLLGVEQEDTEEDATLLANKIVQLRIFEDENGKLNRSIQDVKGSILLISNFTLCANYQHGNRPDFLNSAKREQATHLYELIGTLLRNVIPRVETGVFGADMQITTELDGPVTITMESQVLRKRKSNT